MERIEGEAELKKVKDEIGTETEKISKLERELRKLEKFYNPNPGSVINEDTEAGFYSAVKSGYEEPKTFRQAWHHTNEEEKLLWRNAIKKEIRDMVRRKVWSQKRKADIDPERSLVGCKWVFKVKNNGV